MDFGLIIRVVLLTLLALIICTCNGQKLTLDNQTLENQIDYFTYSGKPARQTQGALECATLRIDGVDSPLCLLERQSTLLQYQLIQDTVYFQSQDLMQKRCLPTRLYQSRLTTRFSLNPYKMVWIDQRLNLHIEYQHQSLQEGNLTLMSSKKISKGWILLLIGRIQVTTLMMGKN